MRIHEVLEACVEYVALEGVLGSDVLSVQQHLAQRDASLDATSFAYLYTLLCQHPSIRIAISAIPLPSADLSVQLGTAPLPEDYSPPDSTKEVDFDRLYREGKRGRELAYHLAGEDFVSSRRAIDIKRAEQDRLRHEAAKSRGKDKEKGKEKSKGDRREKKLEQILGEDGSVLMTTLDEDDEPLGGEPVDKADLAGLAEKWGSRLRIRCTEDEIYFRLTGSHQKIPKLTAPVLHSLQLAARSREKGITAIELGPMVGASQGTMHYYMKVLLDLGLCAKVPAVLHGSLTNLLLFHPFLHLNENYRAIKKLGPLPAPPMAPLPALGVDTDAIDPALLQPAVSADIATGAADDSNLQVPDESGEATASGLAFPPMSEAELMTGHLVRERLMQLLDHPGLQNHLLKAKNLLALIGGPATTALRHRRAIPRCIAALVMDGVIERLEVGPKLVDCLRLTKYNPSYAGPPKVQSATEALAVEEMEEVQRYEPQDFVGTFQYPGGIALNLSFERQINDAIVATGLIGAIYTDLRAALDGAYKRAIEFYILRAEDSWVPPQLRGSQICSVMESAAKERRLRVFSVQSYRAFMLQNGSGVDDNKHPALTEEAGQWNDLYFRSFAADRDDFWRRAELVQHGRDRKPTTWPSAAKGSKHKRPRARDADGKIIARAKVTGKRVRGDLNGGDDDIREVGEAEGDGVTEDVTDSDDEPMPKVAKTRYDDAVQQRGRPRKYIHVVDEDGKVNRRIIGQVLPIPAIPPVLIYVKAANKLVPAMPGYSGVGQPPAVTPEQMKEGHTPAFYNKFEKAPNTKGTVKKKGAKGKGGKKAAAAAKETKQKKGAAVKEEEEEAEGATIPEGPEDRASEDEAVEVDELDSDTGDPSRDVADIVAEENESDGVTPRVDVGPVQTSDTAAKSNKRTRRERSESVVPLDQPVKKRSTRQTAAAAALKAKQQIEDEVMVGSIAQEGTPEVLDVRGDHDESPGHDLQANCSTSSAGPVNAPQAGIVEPAVSREPARAPTPLFELNADGGTPRTEPELPTADLGAAIAKKPVVKKRGKSAASQHSKSPSVATQVSNPAPAIQAGSHVPSPLQRMTDLPSVEDGPVDAGAPTVQDPAPGAPPLIEVAPPKPRAATHINGRVDFALVRRLNELCHALSIGGGVLSDANFLNTHREWAARVGGTNEPFAPSHAYRMDRRVFKHSIGILDREGRIKQTQCSIPTTTGRWIQQLVYWLPETPKHDVDTYISHLTQATMAAVQITSKRPRRTQIEDQAFTEARFSAVGPYVSAKATLIKPTTRMGALNHLRRNALLKQPGVGATLLGFLSGRWLRVQRFLDALKEAMANGPTETSKVSQSPAIFALPLIFEDIPVGTFYECIFSTTYDEDLDDWLKDPDNRMIRLKDVPREFRPASGGFAGNRFKSKYSTILTTLVQLGIASPLLPCGPEVADLTVSTVDGPRYFTINDSVNQATHFIIHDFAPIYHIAADTAGLLGVLPIIQADERERYWTALREACLNEDINGLEPLDCHTEIGLPRTARIAETLTLDIDTIRMLRSPARWRTDTRILPEQRSGIDDQIDWRTGNLKLNGDEDIEAFAYDNALSVRFVRAEFTRRSKQAKDRAMDVAKRQVDAAREIAARRERNQRTLRSKLAEMRTAAKKAWEERIMKASGATGVPYTEDLVKFVTHHTLSIPNRAKLGDKALEDAVRNYVKVTEARMAAADQKAHLMGTAAAKRKSHVGVQAVMLEPLKGTRRRHKWSAQDDELLIDGEAIIRARSRGRIRARQAMSQIFPSIGHQPILNRLKVILGRPGQQQYFERLEQAWFDLWKLKRGTSELRDDTPDMPQSFDLKHHIDYLRANIRKAELRLGISRTAEIKVADLPVDTVAMVDTFDWTYGKFDIKTMQSVTEKEVSDESKSLGYALVPLRDNTIDVAVEGMDRTRGLVRACLKMTVSTPNEIFNSDLAKASLAALPQAVAQREISRMNEEKIVTKQHNGSQTSRMFAYTATYGHQTEGPISTQIMGEIQETAEMFRRQKGEWVDYRTAGTSGDIAVLLEMVSEGTAEIEFDVDNAAPIRYLTNTYNTRRLTDESFEFDLRVKYNPDYRHALAPRQIVTVAPSNAPWPEALAEDEETYNVVSRILDLVNAAGPDGLTRLQLQESTELPTTMLLAAYASLAVDTPPEAFWTGYDSARLVSVEYWDKWSVAPQRLPANKSRHAGLTIPAPIHRVGPRRWVDIYGQLIKDDWQKCLDGVIAHVLQSPGLSELDLRFKLSPIMDRIETNEVIQYLVDTGAMRRIWLSDRFRGIIPHPEATDEDEERMLGLWPVRPLI